MDEQITKILARDLSPELIETFYDELRGEYDATYERLARSSPFRASQPNDEASLYLASARNERRANGKRALASACGKLGIPFEVKSLQCNGQSLVVAQCGQVLLITEPTDYLSARPENAAYKSNLAMSHFAVRQLEFDLGDGYRQRIDSRNTMLAVLRHGMHSHSFNRRNTALSMLSLAVPDCRFETWLWKANVPNEELALYLDWLPLSKTDKPKQEDHVAVTLKAASIQKDKKA